MGSVERTRTYRPLTQKAATPEGERGGLHLGTCRGPGPRHENRTLRLVERQVLRRLLLTAHDR